MLANSTWCNSLHCYRNRRVISYHLLCARNTAGTLLSVPRDVRNVCAARLRAGPSQAMSWIPFLALRAAWRQMWQPVNKSGTTRIACILMVDIVSHAPGRLLRSFRIRCEFEMVSWRKPTQ
ncbi:uncharacterized protein CCOS01_08871 [Colletotrichum costaricense]|uniref:Uncharacterized protein n=1 Tax=Colletotrichum costaricense TaxID=1209916 RepID=A0AAJ0DYI3_9PEZI|nr:uncharacterized protein CCOS01_08871 [Colletotrichum costaricense]KAK1523784.1 hypothetical protein CCOS01_08871 [Colletotrichum costaricense]